MNKPLIWQLTPDRAEEWRAIRLEALTVSPDAFGSTLAEWIDRPIADFADRLSAVETWAAGDQTGTLLAVAGWQPGWTPGTEDMGWITGVFTKQDARGRGLMTALLSHIAQRVQAEGMVRLGLRVAIGNTAARETYKRNGFSEIGAPFVNEHGIREIEMQRDLSEG